jgi:hypothetical protein
MDQEGPKHVGVSGFNDIIVTLTPLCAFGGLNYRFPYVDTRSMNDA